MLGEMPVIHPAFTRADFAAVFGPRSPRPWMTWLLTGAILAVYVAQLAGERHGVDRVGTALAFGPEAWARHRYWTLLTYAFAHAVPSPSVPAYAGFHLVTNVVPLFCLAPAVERCCGPWRLLLLFLASAAGSALAWYAWHPPPQDAMIGASGALFAVIAAGGTLDLHLICADLVVVRLPLRLDYRLAAIVLGLFELAQMFFHQLGGVAHIAHLGGALVGVLFALTLVRAR
jgi:membrane associated rhomboid family serine protease